MQGEIDGAFIDALWREAMADCGATIDEIEEANAKAVERQEESYE